MCHQEINVQKGIEDKVNAVFENDYGKLIKKGDSNNIEQNVEINSNITAPIKKGDVVGKVTFVDGSNNISSVNLVADRDISKITLWNMTTHLYNIWFNLSR